jgi:hypothetical protein
MLKALSWYAFIHLSECGLKRSQFFDPDSILRPVNLDECPQVANAKEKA